ncbi:MAG: hypothetical protein FWE59_04570 [Oscillospiraceae bacterium]|nr:hypothetical protein [Oscillospiraceae bacterium]
MTYETYQGIFIASTILAGLFFLISVALCIKWNIPKVIGDVTGRSAKKAIRGMAATGGSLRAEPESGGSLRAGLESGGSLRAGLESGGSLRAGLESGGNLRAEPASLAPPPLPHAMPHAPPTMLPAEIGPPWETDAPTAATEELSLVYASAETVPLGGAGRDITFVVEYDITFVHTNEIIE